MQILCLRTSHHADYGMHWYTYIPINYIKLTNRWKLVKREKNLVLYVERERLWGLFNTWIHEDDICYNWFDEEIINNCNTEEI